MNDNLGKLPPQEIECESAVLGALMLERDAINEVIDILKPESFYKDQNALIFSAIIDLFTINQPIDLLTVTNQLRVSGNLEKAGGAFYITELTSRISSAANIEFHSRIIAENAMKRDLITLSTETIKDSFDNTTDVFEIISKIENQIIDINSGVSVGRTYSVDSMFSENMKRIQKAGEKKDGITGIDTGYFELNRMTAGWQGSDLIIIAARPSMGKTDLAINLGIHPAKNGHKIAFFSLEMGRQQLFDRFIAIDGEIERENIKTGRLTDEDWHKVTTLKKETQSNFIIQDEPSLTILQLRAIARKLRIKQGVKMIIVDYLQLMTSHSKGNREQAISEISRGLKILAKELNIPVIALSQLSRAVETRGGDKRPMLSDLRESGAIEQDADIVMFPLRPIYYGQEESEEFGCTKQLMEVDFAKNRSGAVGVVPLKYLGKYGKVVNHNELSNIVNVQNDKPIIEAYRPDRFHESSINGFDNDGMAPPF